MSSIVLLASINTIAALLICPLSCVSPHSFLKIFNDILLCVYLLFLAKLITHLLFKQAKLYTTLYVWLCIKCVVYIKSFQKSNSPATRLANPTLGASRRAFRLFLTPLVVDQGVGGGGAHWFRDYFTRKQNLVVMLAKSRFHTACQDYKTAFIGWSDNICTGFFFISVLHKII